MAAGILSGLEGKLNTRGWRWWVFSSFLNDRFSNSFQLHRLFYIEVSHASFYLVMIAIFNPLLQGSYNYLRRTADTVSFFLNDISEV